MILADAFELSRGARLNISTYMDLLSYTDGTLHCLTVAYLNFRRDRPRRLVAALPPHENHRISHKRVGLH